MISRPSGRVVTATYDLAGRQTVLTSASVTRNFGYDDAGRLTSAKVAGDISLDRTFAYNSRGLLERSTDSFGDTTYGYDTANRLSTYTPAVGPATSYTYGAVRGLLVGVRGATNRDYTYNSAGQVTRWDGVTPTRNYASYTFDTAGKLTEVGGYVYGAKLTYDADGRVATVCDTKASTCSTAPKLTTHGYDDAGRLTSAVTTHNGATLSSSAYTWDADGNRTSSAIDGAAAVTADYDLADRMTATSDGITYGYDDDGRLTSQSDGVSYGYNGFGELTSAGNTGGAVTYGRDALGRVGSRTSGTAVESFSYDGQTGDMTGWRLDGGTPTSIIRTPGGTPLAEVTGTAVAQQIIRNFHGDLVGTNDDNSTSSANVRYRATYDPFGRLTSSSGSQAVPLGYQSMYTDQLTGMVNMGFRHYDPAKGRFTARDSLIGSLSAPVSLHRYLYANANPISNIDPDGHWPDWLDDLGDAFGDAWDTATDALSDLGDAISDGWDSFTEGASQAFSDFTEGVSEGISEAASGVEDFWNEYGDQITATVASAVVGVVVFAGCTALTAGAGSVLCAGLAGAAAGALYGGMTCPEGENTAKCVAIGAVAGGVAGLTAGAMSAAGAGLLATNAASAFVGDGIDQVLTTGSIDPTRLLLSTAAGGLFGGFGGKSRKPFASRSDVDAPTVGGACRHSFDPATRVLMADGSTKAIRDVAVGDKVVATDPETGETSSQTVEAVHLNVDTELTDLTVTAVSASDATAERGEGRGERSTRGPTEKRKESVLHTTKHHPFWDATDQRWVDASELQVGHDLTGPDGETLRVTGVRNFAGKKEMRDLTIANVHTYYVIAGDSPVLVHNCGGASARASSSRGMSEYGGTIGEVGHNAAGGKLIMSTGDIAQNDVRPFVNSALMRGDDVHILTGNHGLPDGTMIPDRDMFEFDADTFGDIPGVTVHDLPSMTPDEISKVLNSPGTVIGGFCNSDVCLTPYR